MVHRSAFACAPVCPPYPCKLLSRQCRCYLITAADQRERSALLSTPIYLCLCSRAAGRCFSFTVLPAVPAAYYLPTTIIHTLLLPRRLCSRLCPSTTTTTTTTTLSLPQPCAPTKSRDRIPPPSHPASAQHASTRRNRPSILTLLHSALLLGLSCTTNRRSGHNLNSPTATAFPPNSHPPPDYSVSRAPATCCCCCFALLLLCSALPCRCPPAGSHSQQSYTSTSLPHRPLLFLLLPASPHAILAVSR